MAQQEASRSVKGDLNRQSDNDDIIDEWKQGRVVDTTGGRRRESK